MKYLITIEDTTRGTIIVTQEVVGEGFKDGDPIIPHTDAGLALYKCINLLKREFSAPIEEKQ